MKQIKTIPTVFALLLLTSCSSVSNIFTSADDTPPLPGERISVLEISSPLSSETPLKDNEHFLLPRMWVNNSWPQAGGYPNHSMQNLSFSSKTPEKIWSTSIGRGSRDDLPLNAQPIVADGMVFTMDTKLKVRAFDKEKGKELWVTNIASKQEDDPVIGGGIAYGHMTLFITNGYNEALAISPKTGEIIWRKSLPAPSRAAPSILSGRVYISTIDNRLIALDARNGESLWEYRGISEASGILGAASPTVNQNVVIAAFSSGEVTALRVENGTVAWSDNLSNAHSGGNGLESISDITAMPISDQGLIIAMSYGGKIVAIDERSGSRIWQRDIGGSQTPWVAGNTLYVLSSENQLICMSLLDGSIFWITELARFEDEKNMEDPIHWSSPLMANGRLILLSSDENMIEVDPHNGEIVNIKDINKEVRISPLVSDNTLFVLAEDGTLIAYQ